MPRSVLIVDDDAEFRDLATRVLTGWGHVVVGGVGNVAEAIARARASRPDIVSVDVWLPDGDGFSLTERLVAMPLAHVRRVDLVRPGRNKPANIPARRREKLRAQR